MLIKNNSLKLKKIFIKTGISILFYLVSSAAFSLTYKIPSEGNVIGEFQTVFARSGDTLVRIAEHYDIGMHDIVKANPRLNRRRLRAGTKIRLPSRFLLPSGERQGIVLNLGTQRVFYYHPNGETVTTYPVGIGKQGWSTPMGQTTITLKEPNPTWDPPASIRREAARRGKTLRRSYPPGPHNPLGRFALHLGFSGILMHGTNAPNTIGLRSSHGCIRLFNRDIAELFSMCTVGTPVRVINEPHP